MIREGSRCFASKKSKKAFEEIRESLAQSNEDAKLYDGLEDALVGVGYSFGKDPVAVYDHAKIIDIYVRRDGMSADDAQEFFEFNVLGTGVEHSPIFVEISRDAFAEVDS